MAKKAKPKVKPPETITMLRVANVTTKHGNFLRLMYVTSVDGVVTSCDPAHDYYQGLSEIEARLHQVASALQMPVLELVYRGKPH